MLRFEPKMCSQLVGGGQNNQKEPTSKNQQRRTNKEEPTKQPPIIFIFPVLFLLKTKAWSPELITCGSREHGSQVSVHQCGMLDSCSSQWLVSRVSLSHRLVSPKTPYFSSMHVTCRTRPPATCTPIRSLPCPMEIQ